MENLYKKRKGMRSPSYILEKKTKPTEQRSKNEGRRKRRGAHLLASLNPAMGKLACDAERGKGQGCTV